MFQNEKNRDNRISDYGPDPFVAKVEQLTMMNTYYRTALWTGEHLQMTLMQINPGEDIGLEAHRDHDQYLMVVSGYAHVVMGKTESQLTYRKNVQPGYGIFVPAGTWHNLVNTGNRPLKLFSIYAPPQHPRGTVHQTKAIAEREEKNY